MFRTFNGGVGMVLVVERGTEPLSLIRAQQGRRACLDHRPHRARRRRLGSSNLALSRLGDFTCLVLDRNQYVAVLFQASDGDVSTVVDRSSD